MTNLDRLEAISRLSKDNNKWIHKDIFRILRKEEIWIAAYEKLKGNKGALTPGSTSETMDSMSLERLRRLQADVLSEAYKFQPVKLTYISQANGKRRPLGLPTANDKIVQEVMRIILEAIYEPIFSEVSFGFRTGLGCHDALYHVERKFRWVDYVIEGDIQQAYPTIDHQILMGIIQKRIQDPRFIRLLWKLLGCGVLDEERITSPKMGVPQGSIVSPILANIYYQELDEFIQGIKEQFETPQTERKKLKSQAFKSLEYKINKVYKEMGKYDPQSLERQELAKELKSLRQKRLKVEGLKDQVTRIEYVRYADDWMIGVSGDRALANQVKGEVERFMENTLAQKLHPIKTKITNIRKGNVHFLGYEIFLPQNRPITTYKGKGVMTIRRGQPQLRFEIPVMKITEKLSIGGYLKKLSNLVRPISRSPYAALEDHVIVNHYRSLWLGLYNYYLGSTNRGRLQYIHYLLHTSCAMTLAHRHRMPVSQVFTKYGKTLTMKVPHTKKTVSFPYRTSWKLSERKWLRSKLVKIPTRRYPNLVSRSSLGLPCAVCDSEEGPIEMHHVKHVRKQGLRYKGFHQQMTLLNRKQIPLCKSCHKNVHAGLYDGPSLETLRKRMRKELGS